MDRDALVELVSAGEVAVLCGAGMSTASGIPDYRGTEGSLHRNRPMTYQEFVGDPAARQRYWARSFVGFRRVSGARPNPAHRALTELQRLGLVSGVVTQNVDGLDAASGTRDVIELHGVLDRVVCLGCGARTARARLEVRLADANPGWVERAAVLVSRAETNADGDAELPAHETAGFVVVACEDCGGVLKPDVVFFGEAVEPALVAAAYALVERSRALLVLGSSLTVMSGRRFVLRASKLGLPVAIVNRGDTHGDRFATLKLDAPLESVLTGAVQAVQSRGDGSGAGTGIRGRAQAIL